MPSNVMLYAACWIKLSSATLTCNVLCTAWAYTCTLVYKIAPKQQLPGTNSRVARTWRLLVGYISKQEMYRNNVRAVDGAAVYCCRPNTQKRIAKNGMLGANKGKGQGSNNMKTYCFQYQCICRDTKHNKQACVCVVGSLTLQPLQDKECCKRTYKHPISS